MSVTRDEDMSIYVKGFTLIELMIVVMMIAIIAAIAYPSYDSYIRRSDEAAAQQRIQHIATDLEKFKARQFNYLNFSMQNGLDFYPNSANPKYTFAVKDGDIATESLESSRAIGRNWVIIATPSVKYPKLHQYVMTSRGGMCKKDQGKEISLDCSGETAWTD